MPAATENGSIVVRNNAFGSVSYGAVVYSQFTFESNRYVKEQGLIVRWNGEGFHAENNTNPLKYHQGAVAQQSPKNSEHGHDKG